MSGRLGSVPKAIQYTGTLGDVVQTLTATRQLREAPNAKTDTETSQQQTVAMQMAE